MGSMFGGGGAPGETDAQKAARASSAKQFKWNVKTYEDDIRRQLAEASANRAQEFERQKRIEQGLAKVAKVFKPYDKPSYYKGIKKQYVSAYLPEIEDQYDDAKQENLFSLARNSNTQSSAAAKASSDLAEQKGQQELALNQRANAYGNQAKSNAENRRNALINQVYATADPTTVSAQGVTTGQKAINFDSDPAEFILPGMDYSPLGNLFSTAITGVNAYNNANQYNPGGGNAANAPFYRKSNEGKVVR